MLGALMSGRALTASELARTGGITVQTASSHLSKLVDGGLLAARKQGRHRYFTLADQNVADVLEQLMRLTEQKLPAPIPTGPRDSNLRHARICYDHLAGEMGVGLFRALTDRGLLAEQGEAISVTDKGNAAFEEFGIDMVALQKARRPTCRACLDWSARRTHLAGGLGAALLSKFFEKKWAWRVPETRVIEFSPEGLRHYQHLCTR